MESGLSFVVQKVNTGSIFRKPIQKRFFKAIPTQGNSPIAWHVLDLGSPRVRDIRCKFKEQVAMVWRKRMQQTGSRTWGLVPTNKDIIPLLQSNGEWKQAKEMTQMGPADREPAFWSVKCQTSQ